MSDTEQETGREGSGSDDRDSDQERQSNNNHTPDRGSDEDNESANEEQPVVAGAACTSRATCTSCVAVSETDEPEDQPVSVHVAPTTTAVEVAAVQPRRCEACGLFPNECSCGEPYEEDEDDRGRAEDDDACDGDPEDEDGGEDCPTDSSSGSDSGGEGDCSDDEAPARRRREPRKASEGSERDKEETDT